MTPKERLEAALQHGAVDRPPVICPGGMMNAGWSGQATGFPWSIRALIDSVRACAS